MNKFLHHVGGVETYVRWQAKYLREAGHELFFVGMHPPRGQTVMAELREDVAFTPAREFNGGLATRVKSGAASVYSPAAGSVMSESIKRFAPDMVHLHGTCRQLTPSVGVALAKARLPSVTTMHEYKFVCASQRLWDDSRQEVCVRCLQSGLLARGGAIASRKCVRASSVASLAAIVELPLSDRIWNATQTVLHAPSRFLADIVRSAPYVRNPVVYADLPWSDETRSVGVRQQSSDFVAMYMGRLAPEKGVGLLLSAWKIVESQLSDGRLVVAGDGEEYWKLRTLADNLKLRRVEFSGRYRMSDVSELLSSVSVTIHPSLWHENSPFTVRESLLNGVPALVSENGGLPEMVSPETGTVFGLRADELALAIIEEYRHRRARSSVLRSAVANRAVSDDQHLAKLMELYEFASR